MYALRVRTEDTDRENTLNINIHLNIQNYSIAWKEIWTLYNTGFWLVEKAGAELQKS